MSDCSISWGEESTETEGAIIFGNDYVDCLYQDEPLAPPDARLDVEDDEETDQQQIQQHALATVVWIVRWARKSRLHFQIHLWQR